MSLSSVEVIAITWMSGIPWARVYSQEGVIFMVSLIHDAVVMRYDIGLGSTLRVRDRRYMVHATAQTHGTVPRPDQPRSMFDAWFAFRDDCRAQLGMKITRLLFRAGIQSLSELQARINDIREISGIGPGAERKIQTMFAITK